MLRVSPIRLIFLKRYKGKEEIIVGLSKYYLLIEEHANGDKEYYRLLINNVFAMYYLPCNLHTA